MVKPGGDSLDRYVVPEELEQDAGKEKGEESGEVELVLTGVQASTCC
jgi:hypothetical protein